MYALIVEPQPRRAALFVAAARAEGLDPAVARSDDEARAIVSARGAPALCIVELTMANVDGLSLLAEMRELRPRVPAIVVSAFAELRASAWKQRAALSIALVLSTDLDPAPVRHALRAALGRTEGAPRPPEPNRDPREEQLRLARLHASGLAAAPDRSAALDALVAEIAAAFGVDAAMCTVLGEERELLVAHHGLQGRTVVERGTAREAGIGRHVVDALGGEALVVRDVQFHPIFAETALVREGVVRGFAGVPLCAGDGTVLGALCLLHGRPLDLEQDQVFALHGLARRVSGELELMRSPHAHDGVSHARFAIAHFTAVLEHLDQPVCLWGPAGRLMLANPSLARLLGVDAGTLVRLDRGEFADLLDQLTDDREFVESFRCQPATAVLAHEEVLLAGTAPRTFRWSTKPLALPDGTGQLDVWLDISAERELARAALTDSLTGLANRRGAQLATRREVARALRYRGPLAFLLVDIDHFKRVNDTRGHAVGDEVIVGVAQAMRGALRESDVAARWGGEEFLVALPDTDLSGARAIAERVRAAVEAGEWVAGLRVTVSIGAAELVDGEHVEGTIGRADAALYKAKDAGRNRVG
ncbi:MAG: diguanylate cyclase [Myxococcales bacterium]|nr:diguanylate cyclase [Myxococcales bacterium]